jgi:hypothetical protein
METNFPKKCICSGSFEGRVGKLNVEGSRRKCDSSNASLDAHNRWALSLTDDAKENPRAWLKSAASNFSNAPRASQARATAKNKFPIKCQRYKDQDTSDA